jgi:acyl-CoA synthetase (AMP-forming)/AMP-acid ligase II
MQAITCRIANGLVARNFPLETKVTVYSPNSVMAFACVLGAMRAGGTWIPLNARNALDDNIYFLNLTDCEWLFYHSSFEEHIPKIKAETPALKHFICIDQAGENAPALETWSAQYSSEFQAPPPDPTRLAVLFGTGGTTGRSKAVMLNHLNWETMIACFWAALPVNPEPPVHLVAAPMTHAAGGISFPLMAMGATTVVLPKADPLLIMESIPKYQVTHLFLPPTVIYMMLAHPKVHEFDYSSLRHFIYAAAPMSAEKLKEAMSVFGQVMTQTFGQVEAPMFCTALTRADHIEAISDPAKEKRLLSCGRPALFTKVEIMDDNGNLLLAGERGEIVVRGNLVMQGYYKNPEATAEASAFGWHHTGDVGYKDEDGFVYIVDRKKDMIISGGFNIFSSEVEQAVLSHPAVQDCAVIGVPDEKWGEAVKAVIQLKFGMAVSEAEIIALCKEKVGSVKAPKSVEFWADLPRTSVGKVRKKDIRGQFWQDRDRAVN